MPTEINKPLPVIVVRYDGRFGEPTVGLPDGMLAEIKMVDTVEEDSLIIDHEGVKVYWTMKDIHDPAYMLSDNWFALQSGIDIDDSDTYDMRDMPDVPDDVAAKYQAKGFTDDQVTLAYAIDQGWITQDEINIPKSV